MRKLLTILCLLPLFLKGQEAMLLTESQSFAHSFSMSIDYTKCGSANSTNFPCLVSITDYHLAFKAIGGVVESITAGVPNDIVFSSSPSYGSGNYYYWEVESYNMFTGNLIAWVNIPTLSHSANTLFYMGVGSSSITTFLGGSAGSVWNSNYEAVYHLPNGVTLSATDYTSNGNNGTITGATATTGQIDGGANFSGSGQYIAAALANGNSWSGITAECWFYSSNATSHENALISLYNSTYTYAFLLDQNENNLAANKIGFYAYPIGTWTNSSGSGSGLVSNNTWYYFVVTWGSGGLTIYSNGVSVATNATAYTFSGAYTFTDYLATGNSGADRATGILDEVRIQKGVATSSYITATYNNESSPSTFIIVALIY